MAHQPANSTSFSSSSPTTSSFTTPSSVLIVGSGVFGLGTAYALTKRPSFSNTTITVVDRSTEPAVFPSPDASSVDTSRIIRADYADPAYAALAAEAQVEWRKNGDNELGGQGRYSETGLVLVADKPPSPSAVGQTSASVGDLPPVQAQPSKKSGMDYVRASWENVKDIAAKDPQLADSISELSGVEAIRGAVGTGGTSGSWGYINRSSGWADAEKSMAWLYDRVKETGRVQFVNGTVTSLNTAGNAVTGVTVSTGQTLSAELVIVATGAWTGALVDLSGQATATGQILAYMDITDAEQAQLAKMPTLLNMTSGLFVITPSNNVLKVARHAYGYVNPTTTVTAPLRPPDAATTATVSLPLTHLDDPALSIPVSGAAALRSALREMVPLPGIPERPFSRTRLCWYTDTPSGDFLIDYHPHWRGLFVATGGSGHGFKFLPVLGEKIADCVEGQCPPEFRTKWSWRETRGDAFQGWDAVVTEDGSRGGEPGLILQEELAKGAA
ncbi:FAD dependent oxidoreductase [Pleurostoma richardsiae]|uniref:FAD dependent oxidoreductase n=1 Tax=Pleurostoma richardsiae TaxID=41990 RepID=A0AA38VTY1_9PEZI|nr:FAD dependent oxidoreductase [Pleurostoma richardsiae]